MIKDIPYYASNYVEFVQLFAKIAQTNIVDNKVVIPAAMGNGYLWACNLPNGISLLASNIQMNEDVLLKREASFHQYFILQFNECLNQDIQDNSFFVSKPVKAHNMQNNMVLLSGSHVSNNFFIPAASKLKSIKIIFEKKHLSSFMSEELIEQFLHFYFTKLIKQKTIEPLDGTYRTIMDTIIQPTITQHLKHQFLQTRVNLLLERFLSKNISKLENEEHNLDNKSLARLIKIEALLVENFSTPPPTIETLSRIACISTTKLKKEFKELYHLPIYEYYQKNRLAKAKQLLLQGQYSIKEVGAKVGYSNLGHFAAGFKKEYGILPSDVTAKDEALPIASIIK